MSETTITIREYARQKGCSDTTVQKAIRTGKIVKGVVHPPGAKWPRINPEIADQEWKLNFNVGKMQNEPMAAAIFRDKDPLPEPEPQPAPPQMGRADVIPKSPEPQHQIPTPAAPAPEVGTTMAAAQKARAIYEAKIKELEYKEKLGALVDKAKVYRNLYAYGQEIRSSFQSLPDRIIDDLLAQNSRNESHAMLYNAISDILDTLGNQPEITR